MCERLSLAQNLRLQHILRLPPPPRLYLKHNCFLNGYFNVNYLVSMIQRVSLDGAEFSRLFAMMTRNHEIGKQLFTRKLLSVFLSLAWIYARP